jgi:TolB protein
VRSLATGNGVARLPSWSPDGSKIAFESITDDDFSIAVINSDGTGQKTIGDHVLIEFESAIPPTWSPDGSRVAFTRMPMSAKELTAKGAEGAANLKFDIYSVNADGSGLKALTNTGRAAHPVWSPRSNCRH